MSEKSLTELEWKKFSKGRNLKDAAFVKALAELEKAEKAKDFEAQLKALDEIEKQADALRKANKAEKEVTNYLDDVDKGVGKDRKLAEFEAKKAKKAAEEAAESSDEDETPELLTTKMIPLMRQVRKGDTMQVLVAMAGKDTCVFVSRKPIGPPKRKLLTTYLGTTAGVKFVPGEVIWEENANTFVMRTQAAGLAKKLKAALLTQTEQRYKVRVRGEDGETDDDGEPAEQESGESEGSQESKIPEAPPLQTGEAKKPETAPPQTDEVGAAFNARLAGLMPKVKETIVAAGPSATDVKLKVSEAGVFARNKDYERANKLLDEAEKLMKAGAGSSIPEAPPMPEAKAPAPQQQQAPADETATKFNTRLAGLMPQVKEAIAAAGPNATDVKLKVSEAGVFARNKDYERANALLDEAEKLMKAGAGSNIPEAPPMTEAKAPAPQQAPADEATTKFNDRLAALLPKVKETIAAAGPNATDVKLKVSEAGVAARKKEFDAAHALLDEAEKLMAASSTQVETESKEVESEQPVEEKVDEKVEEKAEEKAEEEAEEKTASKVSAEDWAKRLAEVEPLYFAKLKTNPDEATKMRAIFGLASEQGGDELYDKAVASLDRLEKLISGASAAKDVGYTGIVAYRKTLLELETAVKKVEGQIASLIKAIPEQAPEELELAQDLAENLRDTKDELQDLVDEAMGVAEDEDEPITRALTQKLDELITMVSTDEMIKVVDQNPFGVAVSVEATLSAALRSVRKALPVPA